MDSKQEIDKYWEDIKKEVAILKEKSLKNADIVSGQSDKLGQIDYNNKIIDHNVKLSKWLLNLIDSTFGKIYQKIHSVPRKEKKNYILRSSSKSMSLSPTLTKLNNHPESDILDELEEIKLIHNAMGEEIDKQNMVLENINNKTENISDNLENNIRHCKKITRNK